MLAITCFDCTFAAVGCREVSGQAVPTGRQTDLAAAVTSPALPSAVSAPSAMRKHAPTESTPRSPAETLTWRFDDPRLGPMVVLVRLPERSQSQRFGVLFAFHGRGEALKGPERGARGWLDDYQLEHAIHRLHAPPLTLEDFGGDVSAERLAEHNRRLERTPYRDFIVVMPFLPDALGRDQVFWAGPVLAQMIERELVPRLAQTAALPPGSAWAVDGVSMGGRAALAIGFARPDLFGVVGALQAAVDEKELGRFAALAKRAHATNPAQRLRLLTSDGDYYLDVNHQLKRRFQAQGLNVEFIQARGGHNYRFNRGPGVFEMLLDVEQALSTAQLTEK
jgi:iron(III)-salmochelin esterase